MRVLDALRFDFLATNIIVITPTYVLKKKEWLLFSELSTDYGKGNQTH